MKAVEEIKGESLVVCFFFFKVRNTTKPKPNKLPTNKKAQPSDAKVNVRHHSQRYSLVLSL